jgi:hypothetical protein
MRTLLALSLAAAVLGLSACQPPPKGKDPGRVEATNTTPADRADPQVQLNAQHEFSDRVAQQLAADLVQVPALNGPYRSTVVFGDIVNKTTIVPTSDFEAFRTRIRANLMQSQTFLNKVRFVESKARVDDLIHREGGGGARAALNPQYTFFLNGEMYRAERNEYRQQINEYLMTYNLVNMDSGEIIWSSAPYEVKQVR